MTDQPKPSERLKDELTIAELKADVPPKTLLTALLAAQIKASALNLVPDGANPAFKSKYVKLDGLLKAVLPILNANGLVWTTFPTTADGELALHYSLTHAATGETMNATMPLLLDKQNSQGFGSAITYARRQSIMAVLGLAAGEDDDGQKASIPRSEQPTKANDDDPDRLLNKEETALVIDSLTKWAHRHPEKDRDMLLRGAEVDDLGAITVRQGREIMRKTGKPAAPK